MRSNQLKAGAALSYITMGLNYTISIVYTPIMLRLLGQSEYGLYNLIISLISYLGLLGFGFGSAYVRYYSRYRVNNDQQNIARLNGMFLIVFSAVGVIAVLAGVILAINIDLMFGEKLAASDLSTAKVLIGIMVLNIAFSFPASVFSSYITANEEYVFQKVLEMIITIAKPFVMLSVLLSGYKSIGMAAATTALTIIAEIANIVFCLRKLNMRFVFNEFDLSLMKEMIVFSWYIFINMIIDQVNWNVDKFILGRFRGIASVAVYGLAAQLNACYMSLSNAVSSVFIPRVNRLAAASDNNNELTSLFTGIGRIQFILLSLICSCFIFFGRAFINMWAGSNYSETYEIALLLMVSSTIPLIQNIGIEIQNAMNMHRFRSGVYFFIAIGNIFLSIPLARRYGGVGAAVGTAISLLIGNVLIMNCYYRKRMGLDIKYFWSQILQFVPSLVPPIIAGILIRQFVDLNNIVLFLAYGAFYVLLYCVSMWFLGMNQYEKGLIAKPVMTTLNYLGF